MVQSVVQAFITFSIHVAGGITRQKNKLKAMVCQGKNISHETENILVSSHLFLAVGIVTEREALFAMTNVCWTYTGVLKTAFETVER